jgi:sugar phosphate isomerase/epimerase
MKLAVSNIAWPAEADATVADLLRRHGVPAIEVAPTKVWPRPADVTEAEAVAYRSWWERRGVAIVAMQALLFGQPALTLFDGAATAERTLEYLGRIIRLAGWLGAEALVFGSPKNRLAAGKPLADVWGTAVGLFRRLGAVAEQHRTVFCIEPNPPEYGCDFVTRVAEGAALVTEVGHAGFGLHLDAGGMALTGDTLAELGPVRPRHFHISEPHLCATGTGGAPHTSYAEQLHHRDYGRWYSIEMRQADADWLAVLDRSITNAIELYGRAGGRSVRHCA